MHLHWAVSEENGYVHWQHDYHHADIDDYHVVSVQGDRKNFNVRKSWHFFYHVISVQGNIEKTLMQEKVDTLSKFVVHVFVNKLMKHSIQSLR